jgi:hypothetical protein
VGRPAFGPRWSRRSSQPPWSALRPLTGYWAMAERAGRYEESDLVSIVEDLGRYDAVADLVSADEAFSAQTGTSAWEGFGR